MIPVNRIGYEVDTSDRLKVSAHITVSIQHVCTQLDDWHNKPEYILEQDLKEKCRDTLYDYVYGDIKQEVMRLKNAVTTQLGDGLSGDARLAIARLDNLLQGCRIDGSCEKVEVVTSPRREINSAWEGASLQSDSPPWAEPREVCPPITFRRAVPQAMPAPTDRTYQSIPSDPADCSRDYAIDSARAPNVVSAVEPVQERRPSRNRRRATGTVTPLNMASVTRNLMAATPYETLLASTPADAVVQAAASGRIATPEPATRRRTRFG